jgi:(p)ppGpp synthase/HD superfamily hydrolase
LANYIAPIYKPEEVNAAARRIIAAEAAMQAPKEADLEVVNTWRAAHEYPLNSIHMTLRKRANRVLGKNALSAQRIKRLESITLKLLDRPKMKLSQMQDIGGCRVVLPNVDVVYRLVNLYMNHPVVHEVAEPRDYIHAPSPDSGYRSIHLKFRFCGRGPSLPCGACQGSCRLSHAAFC